MTIALQRIAIARDPEVAVVAAQHRAESSPLLRNRNVHHLPAVLLHAPQRSTEAPLRRAPFDYPAPLPRFRPVVREPEKVEAAPLQVRRLVDVGAVERPQPRLLRVKAQSESLEAFRQPILQ